MTSFDRDQRSRETKGKETTQSIAPSASSSPQILHHTSKQSHPAKVKVTAL